MEASTTTMEVGSTPACMEVAPASLEATNYFHVLPYTSMEVGSRPASMKVAPALGWGFGWS